MNWHHVLNSSFRFPETLQIFSNPTPLIIMVRGVGWGVKLHFWNFLPPIAFNNDPPFSDYENCKKHLPTQLTFTPSLYDYQLSVPSVIFLVLHFYWATLQNSTKLNYDRISKFGYKRDRWWEIEHCQTFDYLSNV